MLVLGLWVRGVLPLLLLLLRLCEEEARRLTLFLVAANAEDALKTKDMAMNADRRVLMPRKCSLEREFLKPG